MKVIFIPALALTAATLLLALLVWIGFKVAHRPLVRFWPRVLWIHLGLLVLHTVVVVPVGLGSLVSTITQTRGDERSYRGPRIAADGTWLVQTRETLSTEEATRTGMPAQPFIDETTGEQKVPVAGAPGAGITDKAELAKLDAAAEKLQMPMKSADGLPLRGFLVPARSPPRFGAVCVHGLFRSAFELETVGSMLRDLGGEVLLVEYRNHGGSGRAKATFGTNESRDVAAALAVMRDWPKTKDRPLVLFGVSLGTVAAALAAPDAPRLAALILDAPIDDLHDAGDRMLEGFASRRNQGPTIPGPIRSLMLFGAGTFGGVDFEHADVRGALSRLPKSIAVLLVSAGQDDRVPVDSVRALYDRLPTDPAKKDLWIVPDAKHGKVWEVDPAGYRQHLEQLLERALGPTSGGTPH
jgi:alpha-beta hydrolase superfamily lysophospholipase